MIEKMDPQQESPSSPSKLSWWNKALKVIQVLSVIGIIFISGVYFGYQNPNPWLQDINYQLQDRINEKNINNYGDRIIIDGAFITAGFYDTNSMLPVMDEGSHGIFIEYNENITPQIGEIIGYDNGDGLIVHRIIGVNQDEEGFYYVTKGDNSRIPDPPVRKNTIKYLLVGVVW